MRHFFPRVERHLHWQPLLQLGQTQRVPTVFKLLRTCRLTMSSIENRL